MSLWGELQRRNVFKVSAAYALIAWIIAQVVDVINEPLGLPEWFDAAVIVLLAIGFPLALLFAWAFELTPEGIKKTHHLPLEQSVAHLTSQKLNYVVTVLLVLAVAFMAIDNYLLEDSGAMVAGEGASGSPDQRTARSTASVEQEDQPDVLPNSVAVLPLENLSPNPDNAYFAAGLHEEILNQLAKLSNLNVISRTTMMRYADRQEPLPEVARELNVQTVMEGSVRFADERILVTVQLIDPETDAHLWSESYPGELQDVFAIQADIAMNVANALNAEFSEEERASIEHIPTDSVEAYDLYLAARAQRRAGNRAEALASIDAALEMDPGFALAWVTKARLHSEQGPLVPADQFDAEQEASHSAALRAVELAPGLSAAQATLARTRLWAGDWIEQERAFRDFAPDEATAERAAHSLAVGDFERAHELLQMATRNDPLNTLYRGFHILGFALIGDLEAAAEEYDRGTALFGRPWDGNWFISVARLGADPSIRLDEIPALGPGASIHNEARLHLGSPEEGLARLRELYAADENPATSRLHEFAVWAGYFGDAEFAFEVMERSVRRSAVNMLHFWVPSMREARQLPEFKALVREIGLVDYWDEFGWPGMCRRLSGDDFECGQLIGRP